MPHSVNNKKQEARRKNKSEQKKTGKGNLLILEMGA